MSKSYHVFFKSRDVTVSSNVVLVEGGISKTKINKSAFCFLEPLATVLLKTCFKYVINKKATMPLETDRKVHYICDFKIDS